MTPMHTVTPSEMRRSLNSILSRVEYKQESITVLRFGKPCAVLVPVPAQVIVSDPTQGLLAAAAAPGTKKIPGKITGKTPNRA
jgi:antitoxin (DNA-binding transcriptional repressor) of toxin-antitoxin stability system